MGSFVATKQDRPQSIYATKLCNADNMDTFRKRGLKLIFSIFLIKQKDLNKIIIFLYFSLMKSKTKINAYRYFTKNQTALNACRVPSHYGINFILQNEYYSP
jgi:hypothetical protein